MWETIRNFLNPKVNRPQNCTCLEDTFRKFTATYSADCPCHKHHIEDDELGRKCKEV